MKVTLRAAHLDVVVAWVQQVRRTVFSLQGPQDMQHSLYMFHPTLPGILLELANVTANIVAFDGEHGLGLWVRPFPVLVCSGQS